MTGIDLDDASIERARANVTAPNVEFVAGDVMSHGFQPAAFDAVVSVAALHHMDEAAALYVRRDPAPRHRRGPGGPLPPPRAVAVLTGVA